MISKQIYVNSKFNIYQIIEKELSKYTKSVVNHSENLNKEIINDPYFFNNDIWNAEFIGEIINKTHSKNKIRKNIKFDFNNHSLKLEIKYIIYKKLFNEEWSLNSLFGSQATSLNKFCTFINEKYPTIQSLSELKIEKVNKEWIWWLNSIGIKTSSSKYDQVRHKTYETKTPIANFLLAIYTYYKNLVDSRNEWEKDKWDIRILNEQYGLEYNPSSSNYYLTFSEIKNTVFKNELKKYLKQNIIAKQLSWGTAINYMSALVPFFDLICMLEPDWNSFNDLKRKHIEKYIEFLLTKSKKNQRRNANQNSYVRNNLKIVRSFLDDIQQFEYSIAPIKNMKKLIYNEDFPRRDKKTYDQIDYIPDFVLDKLFKQLNNLNKDVQPIVWILFKTGLRISDVLGLSQDCLVKLDGKYQIITNIEKTYVKGHSIPIDDQLAKIIAVLIDNSIKYSNEENNPNKYIFVRYTGTRKGRPFSSKWVCDELNRFSFKNNIKDENDNIFYFKNHQFRHTYAVKMLNNGVDILTVQELLAHASPEMTMQYAKLLDNTKRKAFETAVSNGVFSFDLNGEIYNVAEKEEVPSDVLDMLWRNQKLTAIDNPYGSCRARLNGNSPYAEEPPCLTCNGGSPCKDLAVGLSDMDVAKYEIHIQSTSKMIEVAKQYGREEIVEKNKKNLDRLNDIYNTIKSGNILFGRLERLQVTERR